MASLALRIALVILGVSTALFFGLLLFVADCSPACVARGERVPVFVFIGLGVTMATWGLAHGRAPTSRVIGYALLAGGVVALAGVAWTIADGARGAMTGVGLAIAVGCAGLGAWLAFWAPDR